MTIDEAKRVFREAWERLAQAGKCDAWGSHEQARVWACWYYSGCPEDVAAYIVSVANAPVKYAPPGAPPRRRRGLFVRRERKGGSNE